MSEKHDIELNVNGEAVHASVEARTNLVDFLRDQLGLTGSHVGCEQGVCGACTLEVDNVMIRGCLMLAVQADGKKIITIEGYHECETGKKLQSAFVEHNALQCGFCTPGMLASSIEYVDQGGNVDRDSIRHHLSGNYCRCTGYQAIVDAIVSVIEQDPSNQEVNT